MPHRAKKPVSNRAASPKPTPYGTTSRTTRPADGRDERDSAEVRLASNSANEQPRARVTPSKQYETEAASSLRTCYPASPAQSGVMPVQDSAGGTPISETLFPENGVASIAALSRRDAAILEHAMVVVAPQPNSTCAVLARRQRLDPLAIRNRSAPDERRPMRGRSGQEPSARAYKSARARSWRSAHASS